MKISPIFAYSRNTVKSNLKQNNQTKQQVSFSKLVESDFSGYCDDKIVIDTRKTKLLTGRPEHLAKMGEVFRDTSDEIIKEYVANRRFLGSNWKSKKAYKRIMPYIENARLRYRSIEEKLFYLYTLQDNGVGDYSKEIIKLEKELKRMDDVDNTAKEYLRTILAGSEPDPEEEAKWWDAVMY